MIFITIPTAAVFQIMCKEAAIKQCTSALLTSIRPLLSALCDAVVKLGEELDIEEPAEKLAGILLVGRRNVQGDAFCQHLAHYCEAPFQEFLRDAAASTPGELAKVLHTDFIDSAGARFPAQIVHAICPDGTGSPVHPL